MSYVKHMRCPACRSDEGHDDGCPNDPSFDPNFAEELTTVIEAMARTIKTLPIELPSSDEPTRCSNCGRLANTDRPYAICARCEDELNQRPETY